MTKSQDPTKESSTTFGSIAPSESADNTVSSGSSLTTQSRTFSSTNTVKVLVRLQIMQLQGLSALSQIVQAHVSGLCCNSWASRAKIVATRSPQVPHAKLAADLGVAFGDRVIKTSSPSDDSGSNARVDKESRIRFTLGCFTAETWTYGEGEDRYENGRTVCDACFAV